MTRADKAIFIILILFSVISILFANEIISGEGQKYVIVETDGREFGRYKLSEEKNVKTIEIKTDFGYNKIEIYSGYVKMADSDCKGKECVHSKEISAGGIITCLPNKCVVRVETERGVDVASY